tara:strand:- start:234 stop:389 length:156 start_codon:yes stop_codon:yes gene_type:complete
MTLNRNQNITVNVCYEVHGERKCTTLNKYDAFNLRKYVENEKGVVWWFTAI